MFLCVFFSSSFFLFLFFFFLGGGQGLQLAAPMNFGRADPSTFSLCELVTLRALGLETFDFAAAVAAVGGKRELVKPPPVRDEVEVVVEAKRVEDEKERLKAQHPELLASL